jgi:hypothetical protein
MSSILDKIYNMCLHSPYMKKSNIVYIAIHPYNIYGLYDRDKNYVGKRDERLANLQLEHIILVDQPDASSNEELPDITAAKEKLNLDDSYWQNRIFLTHSGHYASKYPSGQKLEFKQLSRLITEMFPAEKYIFWGAELHKPPSEDVEWDKTQKLIWTKKNNKPYGCIIYYNTILDLPNKSIDESHCLIFNF